jgi:hypothetical protein
LAFSFLVLYLNQQMGESFYPTQHIQSDINICQFTLASDITSSWSSNCSSRGMYEFHSVFKQSSLLSYSAAYSNICATTCKSFKDSICTTRVVVGTSSESFQ